MQIAVYSSQLLVKLDKRGGESRWLDSSTTWLHQTGTADAVVMHSLCAYQHPKMLCDTLRYLLQLPSAAASGMFSHEILMGMNHGQGNRGSYLLCESPEACPLVLIDGLVLSLVLQKLSEAW